jgi:tetratricopeptide (TPR) repeat protein
VADGVRIPRVIIDASAMRKLPLGAADGFVLSRIDGRTSEKELAGLTGLPESQIRASLEKLFALKAIDFNGAAAPVPPKPNRPSGMMAAVPQPAGSTPSLGGGGIPADRASQPGLPPSPDSNAKLPAAPTVNALLEAAISGVPDNAPELAEEVDLPPDLKRRVMGLHSVITSLDHYATLGLSRESDKKAIKRSYFELAAVFHPDRYFRKSLGSFKPKMEVIFAKVSTAYETLVDKEQRAEYDLYLGDVEKSRDVEAMLRNVMSEVETAERTIMEQAGMSPSLAPPPQPSSPLSSPYPPGTSKTGSGTYSAVIPRPPGSQGTLPPPAPPARSAVSDQLRREALAMRLKGMNRPVTKPPTIEIPTTPSTPRISSGDAVDALKRRYEERVEASRRAQGDKYAKIGADAESRNDLTAAAAAYRVALTFLREDDPSYPHAKEIILKSETALGETYVRQAEHEERANRWEEAARSWGRAAKLRPSDPRCLERTSHAMVKAGGSLHEASQLAQKAVALAPTVAEYRLTLASVYVAAGLSLNARRELEAAAALFPDNLAIGSMLKNLGKTG